MHCSIAALQPRSTAAVAIRVRLRQLGAIGSLAETLAQLEAIGFRTTDELRASALEAAGE